MTIQNYLGNDEIEQINRAEQRRARVERFLKTIADGVLIVLLLIDALFHKD